MSIDISAKLCYDALGGGSVRRLLLIFALCVALVGCQYAREPGAPPVSGTTATPTAAPPASTPEPTEPYVPAELVQPLFVSTIHGGALEIYPDQALIGGHTLRLFEEQIGNPPDPLRVLSIDDLLFGPPPGASLWAPIRLPDGSLEISYSVFIQHHGQSYQFSYRVPVIEAELPRPDAETLTLRLGDALIFPWDGAHWGKNWQLIDERTGEELPIFEGHSLIAVRATAAPGSFALVLRRVCTESGEIYELERFPYTVNQRAFTRQDLTATSTMTSLLTQENSRSDAEMTAAARAVSSPERFWTEPWIKPMEGRITTQFGQMRYTNGRFSSVHAAIDIGGQPIGAPVVAAAPGIVTMAYPLHISGNTVIIDHGWGVFSSYSHLDGFNAAVGDFVQMGQIIGFNGTTGYSTGPHLHYAVTVGGIFVDPEGFGRFP
jgi:murein DD-endopeptidase MepM/ murein hydrolase activator NlpD